MKLQKLRRRYVRAAFGLGLGLLGIASAILGRDCSFSRELKIDRPQSLVGVLQDPGGAVLPGLAIELLQGKTVVQRLRTNNLGEYDFGQIQPGKYRIHIRDEGHPFCAPKVTCGRNGCTLEPKLKLYSKRTVVVYRQHGTQQQRFIASGGCIS